MTTVSRQRTRSNRRAALLLAAALLTPASPPAHAMMDDMMGVMFRMMLVMMDLFSDAMLDNNDWGNNWGNWNNGLGGFNSFNLGMSAFPAMSGFGSPWSSFGSPWSSFGSPWNSFASPMSGFSSPWNSFGSPWNSGATPWAFPYAGNDYGGIPGGGGFPTLPGVPGYGVPASQGGIWQPPSTAPGHGASLLEGRWYGGSGDVLEVRGNRFRLQSGRIGLEGVIRIENNIVNLYSPQTNTLTQYSFVRNQSELMLQDNTGQILIYRRHPLRDIVHIF